MKNNGDLRNLEADLAEMGEMGGRMTYPTIPNPALAVVARFEAAQSQRLLLLPSLAVSKRWLVAVPTALLVVAILVAAYGTFGGEDADPPADVAQETNVPSQAAKGVVPATEAAGEAEVAQEANAPSRAEGVVSATEKEESPTEAAEEAEAAQEANVPPPAAEDVVPATEKVESPTEAAGEAEVAQEANAPPPAAEDVVPATEKVQSPAEAAEEAEVARQDETPEVTAGLLKVSIGIRETTYSEWAVDPIASTWKRLGSPWAADDPIKVETAMELVGLGLNEQSEAPLANVYVHGNYAFVGGMSVGYFTSTNVGIRILDISDPTKPELMGRIPLRSRQPFDARDPHSHGDAVATHIETDAFRGDIAIVGQGVPDSYTVSEYPMPFGIWDVTDPSAPQLLSVLSLGKYLWLHQTGDFGDKPTDAKAVHRQYFYAIYNAAEVVRRGDWFSYDYRVAVVDLSDPRSPSVVGEWDPPDQSWLIGLSLNKDGTRAYVAGLTPRAESVRRDPFTDGRGVIHVVDLSNPAAPTEIGRYVSPYLPPNSAHVPYAVPNENDSLLVLADGKFEGQTPQCGGHGILHFLDISDLDSIREVSTFAIRESDLCPGAPNFYQATDMAVKGNLVYSTWLKGGLHVVDISDPANPVGVAEFRSPDKRGPWFSDVALYSDESGDYAIASTVWYHGLYVLKLR